MQNEKYKLAADKSLTTFNFFSQGPKGDIHKQIQFQSTRESNLYNLAFGDLNFETGDINDLAVYDNGDTEKILTTVVAAIYLFFERYPDALV